MTNTTYNNNKTIVHSMVRVQQLLIKQWFNFFPEAKLI